MFYVNIRVLLCKEGRFIVHVLTKEYLHDIIQLSYIQQRLQDAI